jgi:urease accessory protein
VRCFVTDLAAAPPKRFEWPARLELAFARRGESTFIDRRRHFGPLRIQRAFHPPGDPACHVYILHPPGGVASGDRLELEATVGAGARALLTTPAATKLYRFAGLRASVSQRFVVASGGRLEWLPHETIAFAGAETRLQTRVDLEAGGEVIALEILCLGRPAAGEAFDRGSIETRLELWRDGDPLLIERARYEGGTGSLHSACTLGGHAVVGTLACVGPRPAESTLAELRGRLDEIAPGETAVTALPEALVCRYRGASVDRAQRALRTGWAMLRRASFGCDAAFPRVWAT